MYIMNSGAKKEIVCRFDPSEIFCRALGRSDARKAEVGVRTGKGMGSRNRMWEGSNGVRPGRS